jgi:hypothetical protein
MTAMNTPIRTSRVATKGKKGLAWILQNRMRQQWYVSDVAATVAVLPAKDPPWQP